MQNDRRPTNHGNIFAPFDYRPTSQTNLSPRFREELSIFIKNNCKITSLITNCWFVYGITWH